MIQALANKLGRLRQTLPAAQHCPAAPSLTLPSSPPIMQSFVTVKGEQGAMPTRIIEYLQQQEAGSRKQGAEAQLSRA